jgi:hypothetical protein
MFVSLSSTPLATAAALALLLLLLRWIVIPRIAGGLALEVADTLPAPVDPLQLLLVTAEGLRGEWLAAGK